MTVSIEWKRLMNLLMQLRKVCNQCVLFLDPCELNVLNSMSSPYLLPDVEPDPYTLGQHVVDSSSKLILIDKLLKSILPTGERVLIFSVRFLSFRTWSCERASLNNGCLSCSNGPVCSTCSKTLWLFERFRMLDWTGRLHELDGRWI